MDALKDRRFERVAQLLSAVLTPEQASAEAGYDTGPSPPLRMRGCVLVGPTLLRDAFNFACVRGMLCHGNMPAPLDDWVIEQLMAREVNGAVPGALAMKDVFTPQLGEQVKITEGPFAQFNGVVEKLPATPIDGLDPTVRITVLANLFGRQTPVELEISQIAKL